MRISNRWSNNLNMDKTYLGTPLGNTRVEEVRPFTDAIRTTMLRENMT